MIGYLFWLCLLALLWWWGTRPAHKSRQDRADLKRIRAAQRRVLP